MFDDPKAAAQRVFQTIKSGGIAIVPLDVAYAICAHDRDAVERIMVTKRRPPQKINGSPGTLALSKEVHILEQRLRDAVRAVTVDHNLPMTVCAPVRMDHPYIAAMDPWVRERSTKDGTLSLILNGGKLNDELVPLCVDALCPVVGSSANRSLQGTRYSVETIEPEVRAIADVTIDFGLAKYANEADQATTILLLPDLKVIRFGLFYERIRDIFRREFHLDLPPRGDYVHIEQLAARENQQ